MRRTTDWGRRWKAGGIWWPYWSEWRVGTRKSRTRAYRSPFSRSGPSCNTSPWTLGWPSRLWRMRCGTSSTRPSSRGPQHRSLGGRSPVFLSNRPGLTSPNKLGPRGANWTASHVITRYHVAALHRTAEFRSGYYALLMG